MQIIKKLTAGFGPQPDNLSDALLALSLRIGLLEFFTVPITLSNDLLFLIRSDF